jgi:hypothetical protein
MPVAAKQSAAVAKASAIAAIASVAAIRARIAAGAGNRLAGGSARIGRLGLQMSGLDDGGKIPGADDRCKVLGARRRASNYARSNNEGTHPKLSHLRTCGSDVRIDKAYGSIIVRRPVGNLTGFGESAAIAGIAEFDK